MPRDANDPYPDYTLQQIYDLLSSYKLSHEALARLRSPWAQGHADHPDPGNEDPPRRPTQWRFGPGGELGHPDAAGAGALRSTANDILTLLAINFGFVKTPLGPRLASVSVPYFCRFGT
jgi:hypothetical protein